MRPLLVATSAVATCAIAVCALASCGTGKPQAVLLNVSYDPTRELYSEVNRQFAASWEAAHGQAVSIRQSHGGSGKQARAVIDGIEADVVTLALAYDIDAIAAKTNLLPKDWQSRLPNNSTPYYSTIVFLVRAGNPKHITDWDDLVKPGVTIVTPNPKTSGGARWNYLAAGGYALKKNHGDETKAKAFMQALFANVPVLDTGARGATTTFVQRQIGDVLLAWENEALLSRKEFGTGKFDIVTPSVSIKAEPPVAVIEANAKRHGTSELARAYLEFLYTDAGQRAVAKTFYRPVSPTIAVETAATFPPVTLFTVQELCGSWAKAQATHFADDGIFDQVSVK